MMKIKLIRLGPTLFSLVMCCNVFGEKMPSSGQAFSFPEFYFSHDSEGFSTVRYRAGYYPVYKHGENYTGFDYQHNCFSQDSWSSSVRQLSLVTKAVNPRTGFGYKANVGYNFSNGHKLFTTDSTYSGRITDATSFEVFLNRDRVETENSIKNGVHSTLIGGSLDHQLFSGLSASVMVGHMHFSDSNDRTLFRTKLIYNLVPEYGITAQLRYKQFRNSNVSGPLRNYFNPESYNEWMLALGIRKRTNGWTLKGVAGLGRQSIDGELESTTQLLEFAAISPVNQNSYYFKTQLGYGKSAGLQGSNYSNGYIMEQIIFPF
ncbi:MAG: hypothetical protein K0R08_40 [Solimicrobium sp.]|nr:hypothetical protein [Solimicrobium sp.]